MPSEVAVSASGFGSCMQKPFERFARHDRRHAGDELPVVRREVRRALDVVDRDGGGAGVVKLQT